MDAELPQEQGKIRDTVGYGHPPTANRFQPGQSGNPAGRPSGRSITAILREALDTEKGGKTLGELIAYVMVQRAILGDIRFIKEVLDRTEGKAPKEIREPRPPITRIEVVYNDNTRPGDRNDPNRGLIERRYERLTSEETPGADPEAVAGPSAHHVLDGESANGGDFQPSS